MKTQKITILFCLVLILQSCMKVDEEKFYGKSNPTAYENNYAYVDLGLSVNWATCNVGAAKPEEYGSYFAWGETTPKTTYDWSTYKWYDGSGYTINNKTVLDKEDDAASVNMGGSWRMPTKEEIQELCNKCFWVYRSLNGVEGYSVIGPNGNSIFLPAAGYRDDDGSYYAGYGGGYYWSSSLNTDNPRYAWSVSFGSYRVPGDNYDYRYYGLSVRPVLGE